MSIRRPSVLLLSLLVAALSPIAAGADPPPAGPAWSLSPSSPCMRDDVTLTLMVFQDSPCDSFMGVEKLDPLHLRVRMLVRDGFMCPMAPNFHPIPVPLGQFPVGDHVLDLEYEVNYLARDGTTRTVMSHTPVSFSVTADCPPIPGPLPYVSTISTDPPTPCAQVPTTLVLAGVFRDGCGRIIDSSPPGAAVELTLKVSAGPDTFCTAALQPWRAEFPLGLLAAGNHIVAITLHVMSWDPDAGYFTRRTYNLEYPLFVAGQCGPPSSGPLPYVDEILIRPDRLCETGPICPGDSIVVDVLGTFPSNCFGFRRIQLVPSPETVFPPPPPTVRIIVDDGGCLDMICAQVQVPWSAQVKLPPQLAGSYQLKLELARVSCSDTYPPGQLYATRAPFEVSGTCALAPPCLRASFAHPPGAPTVCDATVSPEHPAELTFQVRPSVALAGLQGAFRLDPPALRITRLEAIGPAAGMHLNWNATASGASFVLFAEHGAPIPALPPPATSGTMDPGYWPVLRVTVEQPAGGEAPEVSIVSLDQLLGSDIDGRAVPVCPPPPCAATTLDATRGIAVARICAEHACDFNADGAENVLDLVAMVHCANGEGTCPVDAGTRFDCDGDHTLSIVDVMCCARHILTRPPCPDCPHDSSAVRHEPDVAIDFLAPVGTASSVDLPIQIRAADRVGAVTLTLDAPLDRYDVTGLDDGGSGQWFTLHETRDGHLLLGMLQTGAAIPARFGPELMLHLGLRPGQLPGGEVRVVSGEFGGPDGVMLDVALGNPSRELPGTARVALGENRPNPFSAETRFTLDLVAGADVAVGIYDLRGRAVDTLFRGRLPSGPREFRWDGRGADGVPAANGVYFYRAVVGGKTLARKLILMRGD